MVYFEGRHLAHPVLVLSLWTGLAFIALVGVDLIHLSARRIRPEDEAAIYGTSALAHVRLRSWRERAGV